MPAAVHTHHMHQLVGPPPLLAGLISLLFVSLLWAGAQATALPAPTGAMRWKEVMAPTMWSELCSPALQLGPTPSLSSPPTYSLWPDPSTTHWWCWGPSTAHWAAPTTRPMYSHNESPPPPPNNSMTSCSSPPLYMSSESSVVPATGHLAVFINLAAGVTTTTSSHISLPARGPAILHSVLTATDTLTITSAPR
jgi:hypothetical protein